MAKRIVICPNCHTSQTFEIQPNEIIEIECSKCHKTGKIPYKTLFKELDYYPLIIPFAYAKIVKNEETLEKKYIVMEPHLSDKEQKIVNSIKNIFSKKIDLTEDEFDEDNIDKYLPNKIRRIINKIDDFSREKIFYYTKRDTLGYGKIDPLINDPNIEDISCDGSDVPIFLSHRKYGSVKSNVKFKNEEELSLFVICLAQKCGKNITRANPMLDASLPNGSRIQMTLGKEVTTRGSTFSIRKFQSNPFTPIDLLNFKTMSAEMLVYFWLVVENRINVLYVGGTASGKTTVLNALSLFIPYQQKIISIEEIREINLTHPNWIPSVVRTGSGENTNWGLIGVLDIYDLFEAALMQRPGYIIIGEIRGREAHVLFKAMDSGQATYSTMHADSTKSLIYRLEYEPINIPHNKLKALDVISFQTMATVNGKRVRRCKKVIEIVGFHPKTKELLINEVFNWDRSSDQFLFTGKSHVLDRICNEKNMTREQMIEEMKRRVELIRWMDINNLRDFKEVTKLISRYNAYPEETLYRIKKLTA